MPIRINLPMYEIELKAWVDNPEKIEQRLSAVADFSYRCIKKDAYWCINSKTLRIRQEEKDGQTAIFVTQKVKNHTDTMEINEELEFELSEIALPVFIAMLEHTGFTCILQKEKDTKVFIPHKALFKTDFLIGIAQLSVELSIIRPIGCFLEIEILYPNTEDISQEIRIDNSQAIMQLLLDALGIEHHAVEMRPYGELLHADISHEREARFDKA